MTSVLSMTSKPTFFDTRAWPNFQAFPQGYRKVSIHRVMTAERPETSARRLATLIDASADGRKIDPMQPAAKP
jgi:hypothetical protein